MSAERVESSPMFRGIPGPVTMNVVGVTPEVYNKDGSLHVQSNLESSEKALESLAKVAEEKSEWVTHIAEEIKLGNKYVKWVAGAGTVTFMVAAVAEIGWRHGRDFDSFLSLVEKGKNLGKDRKK